MFIKNSTPVVPNFIKILSVVLISAISMTAYANHHGQKKHGNMGAKGKGENTTEVMQQKRAEATEGAEGAKKMEKAEKSKMSDEETKAMQKEERKKLEMQRHMDEGDNKPAEEAAPE